MRPAASDATVVALCGADREDLAATLDTIAIMAGSLSIADMRDFALQLADDMTAGRGMPGSGQGCRPRAAIVSANPKQLAERARIAAHAARTGRLSPSHATRGCYVSDGARGRVVLLFPGLADTQEAHAAMFGESLRALDRLDRLGIAARVAVGYSMGEITALTWAGSIAVAEAARLVAQRAEVLRSCPRQTAMVRVAADAEAIRELSLACGVEIAADEGPARKVLAGHAADIRALTCRALAAGMTAEGLATRFALHYPALRGSVPPMRVITSAIRFSPPRRRVVSTITGQDLTPEDDLADLAARQLAQAVRFAQAIGSATQDADLIIQAGPDVALAAAAAACTQLPVVVLGPTASAIPAVLAASFAAGAIDSLRPFLATAAHQAADQERRSRSA